MAKINLILVFIITGLLACSEIIADSFKALVEKRRCGKSYGSCKLFSPVKPAVSFSSGLELRRYLKAAFPRFTHRKQISNPLTPGMLHGRVVPR
ncbi:hypothetical protein EAF04_002655 [Stromatinia cepivora]|nr:hypothetical protein EAF04_002655 [Stromatinia cepivora]